MRQGRTDAWIAHQLEISASELREFRRQHDLNASEDDPSTSEIDLRDEIEAEIEAATAEEAAEEPSDEATTTTTETLTTQTARASEGEGDGEGAPRRRRRRGRRGRRRRKDLEATFDHGEEEGYGLWLDPAVQDDNVYSENWKGHRAVTVTIEPDRIVIRRVEADNNGASAGSDEPASTGSDDPPAPTSPTKTDAR